MNATEHFPILDPLLAQKRPPVTAPWSTCELQLTGEIYEGLLSQTLALPRYRFDRFLDERALVMNVQGHRVSNRVLLGLVLTIVMAEYARREASEGHFWTVIARRFESASFYHRLFTSVGQPTSLCREVLEQTARIFNLRHIYGQEGHKEWYSSVVLQIGFTRRGFERRLAEWLAGQQGTLAVRMLLEDPALRSSGFHKLWDALWTYRKGNRTAEQVRQTIAESPWVLPEWADTLLRIARERRELDALPQTDSWEEETEETDAFLSEPVLVWETPDEPYLKTTLVRLADLTLTAPDYAVRVGELSVGRLLRQPDGSYYADHDGELRLPLVMGCLRVELVSPLDEIAATQEIEISDVGAEATLYDASTGLRLTDTDGARLVQNHRYVLLLSADLDVFPTPIASHQPAGARFKVVALPPFTAGVVRVSLEGETLWEWSILPRPVIDSSTVRLVWGNYVDDGHAGAAYARLYLPTGWRLHRARKDFRTLDFTDVGNGLHQSDTFPITPDDHVRDVRIEVHLRFNNQPVRKSCRLSIPTKGVLWQKRGAQDFITFEQEKPLYTHSAQHDRFLFRLAVPKETTNPRDIAQFYRNHVLMEGAFFHRRLGQKPTSLGQLHGFGQRLHVKPNGFNSNEPALMVSEAVFDTGLLGALRQEDGERPAIELRQPIYPGPEHTVLIVGADLSITALPCEVIEGTKNCQLVLPADAPLTNHLAIGLFYRGVRLGSIWNHPETQSLKDAMAVSPEQALRAARLMRILKFPLLSDGYFKLSRALALNNLPAFVTAWLDEQPVIFGEIELKSPGLDESAAYAFGELAMLDPIDLAEESVATLVETYGGNDPLITPDTALLKVAMELDRLSPRLAADVVKRWIQFNSAYFRRGIGAHTVLTSLRTQLLGGLTEAQILSQISTATQTDETFIHRHLQSRFLPNWKSNVRALQHLLPFRVLLTRAFLNGL